jgi:uncharacterized protein with PQ loop repeat
VKETFIHILIFLYGTAGILGIFAYMPTIRDLYKYKKQSANITSYALWFETTGISLLYGMFVIQDGLFIFISGTSFVACSTILALMIPPTTKPLRFLFYTTTFVKKIRQTSPASAASAASAAARKTTST